MKTPSLKEVFLFREALTDDFDGNRLDFDNVLQSPKCRAAIKKRGIETSFEDEHSLGSGYNGEAFKAKYKGKEAVLKITEDYHEAEAAQSLVGRKHIHLYNVYDVFNIEDTDIYGIVQEVLEKIDPGEIAQYKNLMRKIESVDGVDDLWNGDWPSLEKKLGDELSVLARHFQIPDILGELRKNSIKFDDFGTNLMKRGGDFVLMDLGNKSEHPRVDIETLRE